MIYRGCADPENLPLGVDISVGCQGQGISSAIWWFCDGTLCNGGVFDDICHSQSTHKESSHPIKPSKESPQPIKPSYKESPQPIKPSKESPQPIKPSYIESPQPIKPSYIESSQPIKPSYIESPQPIKPYYIESPQPIKPYYIESPQPIKPSYIESPQPIKPSKESPQPIKPSYIESPQPIKPYYIESPQPIKPSYIESPQPIKPSYKESPQPIKLSYIESPQPIKPYYKESQQPIESSHKIFEIPNNEESQKSNVGSSYKRKLDEKRKLQTAKMTFEEIQRRAGFGNLEPIAYGGSGLSSESTAMYFNNRSAAILLGINQESVARKFVPNHSPASVPTLDAQIPREIWKNERVVSYESSDLPSDNKIKPKDTKYHSTVNSKQVPDSISQFWDFSQGSVVRPQNRYVKTWDLKGGGANQNSNIRVTNDVINKQATYAEESNEKKLISNERENGREIRLNINYPQLPGIKTPIQHETEFSFDLNSGKWIPKMSKQVQKLCMEDCTNNPSGLYSHPTSSNWFVQCGPGFIDDVGCQCCQPFYHQCPETTNFDPDTKVCR